MSRCGSSGPAARSVASFVNLNSNETGLRGPGGALLHRFSGRRGAGEWTRFGRSRSRVGNERDGGVRVRRAEACDWCGAHGSQQLECATAERRAALRVRRGSRSVGPDHHREGWASRSRAFETAAQRRRFAGTRIGKRRPATFELLVLGRNPGAQARLSGLVFAVAAQAPVALREGRLPVAVDRVRERNELGAELRLVLIDDGVALLLP